MVKSSAQIVTYLQEWATYASFKAWISVVEDWVLSHTHTMPDNLGPTTVHTVVHLIMSLDIYSLLETCSMLGTSRLIGLYGQIKAIPPGGR